MTSHAQKWFSPSIPLLTVRVHKYTCLQHLNIKVRCFGEAAHLVVELNMCASTATKGKQCGQVCQHNLVCEIPVHEQLNMQASQLSETLGHPNHITTEGEKNGREKEGRRRERIKQVIIYYKTKAGVRQMRCLGYKIQSNAFQPYYIP